MVSFFPYILSVGYDSCFLFLLPQPSGAKTHNSTHICKEREPTQAGKEPTKVGNDSIPGGWNLGQLGEIRVSNLGYDFLLVECLVKLLMCRDFSPDGNWMLKYDPRCTECLSYINCLFA